MACHKLSDAERAERRKADRDRLTHAVAALLSSEGWERWVKVRARNGLTRYSLRNQLLIAHQLPQASYVAGFRAFLELNRCVRKGEHAIRIFAPMSVRRADHDTSPAPERDDADDDERRTVFRAVAVFDVSQTDPLPGKEPAALQAPCEPIDGESHGYLLDPLRDFARELGYHAILRTTGGEGEGWCDYEQREIVVNCELPPNAQVRVLVHEIAHALGIGYRDYGRRRAEVLVDTVTYIVCGAVGLDTSGESVPYVAGWGGKDELGAIQRYAETIDTIARRIEDNLNSAVAAGQVPTAA
ncbi:MAG TPA: ArdC family protein [Solirubrobacteraceae bacterium]|nr:ArdC family protein [Solirubrobacteraceae bacterium]